MDPRTKKLAEQLLHYSINLQKGENILLQSGPDPSSVSLVKALIREVYRMGGHPFVRLEDTTVTRELLMNIQESQLSLMTDSELLHMKKMDAFVGIRLGGNPFELSDVPKEKLGLYQTKYHKPLHLDCRVPHTRWVVLVPPSEATAQAMKKSREAAENFYYSVCTFDYAQLSKAMRPLAALMDRTDRVRITGPGTDLSFSIKGIPVFCCDGHRNIPDGEVFTAPVKNSVNGRLSVNTSSLYQGSLFSDITFTFKDGKIVEASANKQELLDAILNTDEGARFIGEFAIGFNPFITEPMHNTLFDEKIAGSFHFTPGNSYETAFNGNRSAIHWDLVTIQRPEWGGGEIFFDDNLIRKDGLFLPQELQGLNPAAFGQ